MIWDSWNKIASYSLLLYHQLKFFNIGMPKSIIKKIKEDS